MAKLNDLKIKRAQNGDPILHDGDNLYLRMPPAKAGPRASKRWIFKYVSRGKSRSMALGTYPAVSLKQARQLAAEQRELLSSNIDPIQNKQAVKASRRVEQANTFGAIAREWHTLKAQEWNGKYGRIVLSRLNKYLLPELAHRPINEITPQELLAVLNEVNTNNNQHRAKGIASDVFKYAIRTGRAVHNPAATLTGALPALKNKNFAATVDPVGIASILRRMSGHQGTIPVMAALQLVPYLFVRNGELSSALWEDIDLDKAQWRFKASKTKSDHIVPLPVQAVAILQELHKHTGRGEFVFPGARSPRRHMSENALICALRSCEITQEEMSIHGFRATARTLLVEEFEFDVAIVEMQLAHAVRDAHGTAYNRTQFLAKRTAMMQVYADYLDSLRDGKSQETGNVVSMR